MNKIETSKLIDEFNDFCLERDYTLQQLSTILKISISAIADILKKKTVKPHERTLHKIKKFMGKK